MKRKERRMLSGIKKGALYLYRHSSIINISLDDIDDWLCEFYLASDFFNTDRVRRICQKDTEWIIEQIGNRINPREAAVEYKKTHM